MEWLVSVRLHHEFAGKTFGLAVTLSKHVESLRSGKEEAGMTREPKWKRKYDLSVPSCAPAVALLPHCQNEEEPPQGAQPALLRCRCGVGGGSHLPTNHSFFHFLSWLS